MKNAVVPLRKRAGTRGRKGKPRAAGAGRTKRNPFEDYQTTKQSDRLAIVVPFLTELAESRVRFENVTALAEMVAQHVALKQAKPCSTSTLLRNKKYKAHLLGFMVDRSAVKVRSTEVREDVDSFRLKIETGNLRREVERLKHYIASLESRLGVSEDKRPDSLEDDQTRAMRLEAQTQFAQTCQALQKVLRHMAQTLGLDREGKCIVDLSKLRNNIVVDNSLMEPFFDWLASNQSTRLLDELRSGRQNSTS